MVTITSSTNNNNKNDIDSIFLPYEDFADDLDLRLGRANGNTYQRKPPLPGVHDGQIMVRLKKKRFIIIDYSIIPTAEQIAAIPAHYLEEVGQELHPVIMAPPGAGTQICTTPECTKVGVPVMLYDSNPEEPLSLYLRSGLCFSCQRNLNEKRRTQRKRKSDQIIDSSSSHPGKLDVSMMDNHSSTNTNLHTSTQLHHPNRFRLNDDILDLNPHAVIINGPLDGTKPYIPGSYEYKDIIEDLKSITVNVHSQTLQLADLLHSYSLNNTTSSTDTTATNLPDDGSVNQEQTDAAVSKSISDLYDHTFLSMSKGIFLLAQLKSSWDARPVSATALGTASSISIIPANQEGGKTILKEEDQQQDSNNTSKDVNYTEVVDEEDTLPMDDDEDVNATDLVGDNAEIFGV